MAKEGEAKQRHARTSGSARTDMVGSELLCPLAVSIEKNDSKLKIRVDRSGDANEEHDITSWLSAVAIADQFAHATARELTSKSTKRSRRAFVKCLSTGFFTFVNDEDELAKTPVSNWNKKQFSKFVAWLNSRITAKGVPYTTGTKMHMLGAVRAVLKQLKKAGIPVNPDVVPSKQWRGESSRDLKTTPMALEEYKKFGEELLRRVKNILEHADEMMDELDSLEKDARSMHTGHAAVCAYKLLNHYGGFIPEGQSIIKNKDLPEDLVKLVKHHGAKKLTLYFGPSPQHQALLVTYLAIHTAFNEQPLLDLKTTEIEFESVMGRRMLLRPFKNRSGSRVRRSFANDGSTDSPINVIRVILRWTARLRAIAPAKTADDLFLYVPRNRKSGSEVRSFSMRCANGLIDFRNAQAAICKKMEFGSIGLRTIRATSAELVHEASNGNLILASALLGHKSIATTAKSYRSENAKKSAELALAGAMELRERHLKSSGTIDPRKFNDPAERSAVTPGWRCIDPWDSPILGQAQGRLCSAYPFCPACPLAQPVEDKALALARFRQLSTKLIEVEQRMGARSWIARFGPVFSALAKQWIPMYEGIPETSIAADALLLSPIPDIE